MKFYRYWNCSLNKVRIPKFGLFILKLANVESDYNAVIKDMSSILAK